MAKFGRYFARKGWFGFSKEAIKNTEDQEPVANDDREPSAARIEEVERKWHAGEVGSRILIEVATAYAITKVLLPVRILFSVWATPWTARVFFGRIFSRTKSAAVGKRTAAEQDITKGMRRP